MTIARLSGVCAIAVLSTSAAFANNECTKTSPDVEFLIDGTNLFIELYADVTDSANATGIVMPDLAPATKGWNACFNADYADDETYVTVSYSSDGTEWAQIKYSTWENSTGYPQKAQVLSQAHDIIVSYDVGTNTLTFEGGE